MFAAATQIEPTPVRVGSTYAEDWITRTMVVLMIIGSLMVTFGSDALIRLMKL